MENERIAEMLENRTALQISLIGVGNAGNQLLNEAIKHDIEVYAINSSLKDLQDSIVDKNIRSFIIGNQARGTGKNRQVAKEFLKVNGLELMTEVTTFIEMCERSDAIIVAAATGGGTGSGTSPIFVDILKRQFPNKIIIFCGILPRLSDVQAQENSVECIKEIN